MTTEVVLVLMAVFLYVPGHFAMIYLESRKDSYEIGSYKRILYYILSIFFRMTVGALPLVFYYRGLIGSSAFVTLVIAFGVLYFGLYPSVFLRRAKPAK